MTNIKKFLVVMMVASMSFSAFAGGSYVEKTSDLEFEAEVESLNILDHEELERETRKEALNKETEEKALRNSVSKIRNNNKRYTKKSTAYANRYDKSVKLIEKLRKEKAQFEALNQELNNKIKNLESKVKISESSVIEAKKTVNSLSKDIAKENKKFKALTKRQKIADKKIKKLRKQRSSKKAHLAKLKRKNKNLTN